MSLKTFSPPPHPLTFVGDSKMAGKHELQLWVLSRSSIIVIIKNKNDKIKAQRSQNM